MTSFAPAARAQTPAVRYVQKTDTTAGGRLPQPYALDDPCQLMTPLSSISLRGEQGGRQPEDYASRSFPFADCQNDAESLFRSWATLEFNWAPSACAHHPLYFEDVNLERHGLSFGIAQPAVSAAHFFGNILALPYHVTNQHPHHCVYDLGHCRPGRCVPYYHYHSPLNVRAGLAEAGTIVGLVFLIP